MGVSSKDMQAMFHPVGEMGDQARSHELVLPLVKSVEDLAKLSLALKDKFLPPFTLADPHSGL